MKREYTLLVKDTVGVLNRITGYIRRNGWNVETVQVGPDRQAGQSILQLGIVLTDSQALRFEQQLSNWNFVFKIEKNSAERIVEG